MPERSVNTEAAPLPEAPAPAGSPPTCPHQSRTRVAWILAGAGTLCVLAFLGTALLAYFKTVDTVAGALEHIDGLAAQFGTQKITETFRLHHLEATSTNGAILEVATADSLETFSRSTSLSFWSERISLGTTVSEIQVPVVYRYHLRLDDDWTLSSEGDHCIVRAPGVRPSLPVAIDTSRMRKKTRSGWARFDKDQNLAELERSLTPKLSERAAQSLSQREIREECRESVGHFVRDWLLREGHWEPGRFTRITILFPGEKMPTSTPGSEDTGGGTLHYLREKAGI